MNVQQNPALLSATILAASLAFGIANKAHAIDYTWGGGAHDWNNTSASGWNGGPPGGGDTATINSGTVTLTTNNLTNPLASVTIGGTGKITQNTGNTWSALNNLTLGGGTLESVRSSADAFGSYQISNTVNVTGSTASTLSTSGSGSIFINLGLAVNDSPTFTTFDVSDVTSDSATDLTVSTVLANNIATDFFSSSAAGLIKTGAGTMTLSANNNYTAGTTVNQGVLEIAGSSAGNGYLRGAVTVIGGAELRYTGGDGTGFGFNGGNKLDTININGGLVQSQNGMAHLFGTTVNMTSGELRVNDGVSNPTGLRIEWNQSTVNTFSSASAAVISGRINLRNDGGYSTAVFNVEDGDAATDLLISAAITQDSPVGITKNGAGTMELSGTNSYTGTTTVNGGVLKVNTASFSDTSAVVIGFDGKMHLNYVGNDIVGSLVIDGVTVPSGSYGAAHPTYGDFFDGSGTLLVGAPGPQVNGTWIASADGNWSDSGNWLSGNVANGSDNTAIFNPGAAVAVTVNGNRFIGALTFTGFDTTLAGTDTLTLDNTTVTQPQVNVASGLTATLATNIGGTLGLEKTGPGTLVLTGGKSYTGGTLVSDGTLELKGATGGNAQIHDTLTVNPGGTVAFTDGDGTGFGFFNNPVTSVTVDGGTINAVSGSHLGFGPFMTMILDNGSSLQGSWQWNGDARLSFSSYGDSTNTISGTLNLRNDDGNNHTLFVDDGANATDLLISGTLAGSNANVVKTGTGALSLTGTNTYTGNTVVSDGTLSVTSAGSLRFRPTTNGTTNSVSGSATASLAFLGTMDLDLGAADATLGNSWNLFNLATFSGPVPVLSPAAITSNLGTFTEVTPGTWERPVTGAKWVFTEMDGNLAYVNATTDYDTWKSAYGVTGGKNDDDDNDGLTNQEEYAFGLVPTNGSSINPIAVRLDQGTGTFSYTRRKQSLGTGLTYSVWFTTDLAIWTKDTGATEGTPVPNGDNETVEVTLSALPGSPLPTKLFIQVRAE